MTYDGTSADITKDIIGCAIEVHKTLGGPGALESVYQRTSVNNPRTPTKPKHARLPLASIPQPTHARLSISLSAARLCTHLIL